MKDDRQDYIQTLNNRVQYLLDHFVVCPEGTFTFPDGEAWKTKNTGRDRSGVAVDPLSAMTRSVFEAARLHDPELGPIVDIAQEEYRMLRAVSAAVRMFLEELAAGELSGLGLRELKKRAELLRKGS